MKSTADLISSYYDWLHGRTNWREVGGGCTEITTPYLDRHNDYIQIYLQEKDGEYLITDEGYTLADLAMCGCDVYASANRKALLEMTLNGFAVEVEVGGAQALQIRATKQSFPLRMHSLVQAILAVNDLFYLSRSSVANFFLEDVGLWLDTAKVRWSGGVSFTGRSHYAHRFDFLIPKSDRYPDRLLRAMNNPSRDTVESFAFAWVDTQQARKGGGEAFAVLNDSERTIGKDVTEALSSYGIQTVFWGRRGEVEERLAS